MASQIVLLLLASLAVGGLLVLLGFRGRRINKHPICTLCGFDLEGTWPQTITCPECGAGLRRRKGVRIGARRKRWITLSVGALLIVLPAGLLATALYAVLTGADLNAWKPVGLLLWEGRRAGDATAAAAAKELLARVQNRKLSADQVKAVATAVLEMQADHDVPWRTEWGDIIETARLNADIGNEDYQQFMEQAPVLEFFVRPRVRQGDPIAVEARLKEARIGGGSQFSVTTQFTGRAIDGEGVPRPPVPGAWLASMVGVPQPSLDDQPGYFHISGASAMWGGLNQGQCRSAVRPRDPLTPGPHTLELELTLTVQVPPPAGGTWTVLAGMADRKKAIRTARLPFVVAPPEEKSVRLVEPTPEQAAIFASSVTPENFQVNQQQGGPLVPDYKWGHISFNPTDLPLDAAFKVKLRTGTSTSPEIGKVVFRKPDPAKPAPTGRMQTMANHQWVSLQLPKDFDAKTVTVILEPDLDAALETVDLTEIYGQTLEFPDVTVTRQQW